MDERLERACAALRSRAALIKADAEDWCPGRLWQPRAAILAWLAYVLVRQLADSTYQPVIGALNFGIHELGHFVFRPFGELIGILGGSLFQCLVPIVSVAMFFRQRDYFAIAFSFGWLATNIFYVATYCADARAMELPLFSPGGGDAYHDWNYILDRLHLLPHDQGIALAMRCVAVLSMLVSLAAGGWLVRVMARSDAARGAPHSFGT